MQTIAWRFQNYSTALRNNVAVFFVSLHKIITNK